MTACREFAKWPLQRSESMRKKCFFFFFFWYDETKPELFALTARRGSWQSDQRLSKRPGTVRHDANAIPTKERGKKFNQFSIESFQTKEWSLNTSLCNRHTQRSTDVVVGNQLKNCLGQKEFRKLQHAQIQSDSEVIEKTQWKRVFQSCSLHTQHNV